jgi:hypothetical protein
MNMKQLTLEQLAARDERRSKFQALVKQLAELTDDERAARLRGFGFIKLSTQASYSPANSLLIAFQSANVARPTILGGFAEWLKKGRAVRKGEHGFMIWVPIGAKKQEVQAVDAKGELTTMLQDASSDVRFIIGTVFDISQTEEKTDERSSTDDCSSEKGAER